jgi:hypothetical protein
MLRVLSLPCATGEEAYSVSIALLDAGLRGARFTVRGVDVSERALGHARRAEYGKNSFRGNDGLLQRGYFEAASGSFRVVDAVREPVSFAKGNVLDAGLCSPRSCDVVLCRNLLIYLDPAARARALDNLWSWLVDDGLLFAGHAEAVEQMDARFQRLAESNKAVSERTRRETRGRSGALWPRGPSPRAVRERGPRLVLGHSPATARRPPRRFRARARRWSASTSSPTGASCERRDSCANGSSLRAGRAPRPTACWV